MHRDGEEQAEESLYNCRLDRYQTRGNFDLSLMQRGLGVVGNVGSLRDGETGPGGVEVEGQ